MEGYVRTQAILFGDFKNYNADSKNIFELMSLMKEFEVIPNVIDEMQLEIRDNKPIQKIVKKIQLISNSHKFRVVILDNSIEIQSIPELSGDLKKSHIDIHNFANNCKVILKLLLVTTNGKANRISLVTTF